MTQHEDGADEVGYGKPPLATRFQPGQSGNPKGRRKGSKNLATVLRHELSRRVRVTEGGATKSITKGRAIATQVVNKAASGDIKSATLLFRVVGVEEAVGASLLETSLGEADQLVMEDIVRRIREMEPRPSAATARTEVTAPEQAQGEIP